jgi:hypothetical protein
LPLGGEKQKVCGGGVAERCPAARGCVGVSGAGHRGKSAGR